jgi:hypothetical protein
MFNLSRALGKALTARKLVYPEQRARADRIDAIRKKIERGEYKIDCEKIAGSVVRTFVDEKVAYSLDRLTFPALNALSLS